LGLIEETCRHYSTKGGFMLAFLSSPIPSTKPITPIVVRQASPRPDKRKKKSPTTHHENQEEQLQKTVTTNVVA
jgi:hypothetical protein